MPSFKQSYRPQYKHNSTMKKALDNNRGIEAKSSCTLRILVLKPLMFNWDILINTFAHQYFYKYEGNSIIKLQIVIEKTRMEIMTYKQHLFFDIISIQI